MQRRNFIKQICRASIVCAAPPSIISLQSCSDNTTPIDENINEITIDLENSQYKKLNIVGQSVVTGSIDFDRSGLLLFRKSQLELLAYSRSCPHAGTSINNFLNGTAVCPNHGAKFKTNGTPVPGGPTNASLKQYIVDLDDSTATIFK